MLQRLTFAEEHLEVHQIILTGNFWEKGGGGWGLPNPSWI